MIRNSGLLGVTLKIVPVFKIEFGEVDRFNDDAIVGLGAQSGRRPVGAARQHGLWLVVRSDIDDEFVVADLAPWHVAPKNRFAAQGSCGLGVAAVVRSVIA